jgi:hypothetical protein
MQRRWGTDFFFFCILIIPSASLQLGNALPHACLLCRYRAPAPPPAVLQKLLTQRP